MSHAAAITFTLAQPTEALEIARLTRDLIEDGLPWSWTPERIERLIRAPETVVLVARSGPHVAGFGVMQYDAREAHLILLAVAPRWRRNAIGSRLLEWLEKSARVAGLAHVDLEVRARNRAARQFYEAHGYQMRDYVPRYYGGREAAIRMRHPLGEAHKPGQ